MTSDMLTKINATIIKVQQMEGEIAQLRDERQRLIEGLCAIYAFGHTPGRVSDDARMTKLCLKIECPCFCGHHVKQPIGAKT